jgi:hypothetical protein
LTWLAFLKVAKLAARPALLLLAMSIAFAWFRVTRRDHRAGRSAQGLRAMAPYMAISASGICR